MKIIYTLLFLLFGFIGSLPAQTTEINHARALNIYRNIISFRTAAGHDMVPEMTSYLSGEFTRAGFSDDDINILPVNDTAALVVRYQGDGTSGKKPILFLAHMDVVDATPDEWTHEPFVLNEDDTYFHGRGTSDNKYGVMNLTQSFIRLKRQGFVPNRDLLLVFSGDEETTQATTNMLVNDYRDLIDAEFAINSDSGGGSLDETGMPLAYHYQAAEKTYATFEITATNPGGHSARPRLDNAIYELAEAILKIKSFEFPAMSNAIVRESLRAEGKQMGGAFGDALVAYADNPKDQQAIQTILANDDYDQSIRTTCVATLLRGGQVENALPQSATVTVNCRIFPGTRVKEIQDTLVRVIDNPALKIVPLDDYFSSPASEPRDDVVNAIASAVHKRYPGMQLVASMSSGYTDARVFRRAGIPTFGASAKITGPGSSNAHGINERFPSKAFYDGLDHWIQIIQTLASK
ncbi:MAG: M20/M25/M40 family metallo-hydrolase [Gammaproteobacteria bacterium]|nr:M20/M25/M40 family metallo-hydrolase [Gammaproteobacteria bacterium]